MVKKKWIAIIPARGGSKRIPKKNILEVLGKPMIAHTIQAAIDSEVFDDVIVNTDDEEIASVSKANGAKIPFLRSNYADDYSPVSQVTIDTITRMKTEFNEEYEYVVQLMANCPLRGAAEIKEAVDFFVSTNNDFQISCFKYGWMNPWWAHRMDEKNKAVPIFSDEYRSGRSQDLPVLYCPTGAIWIAKVDKLLEAQTFYGENYTFCPMHWSKALDIDDYDDLEMIQALRK